jgi:hypothetical protein
MSDPIRQHHLHDRVAGDDVVATPEGDNEYAPDEPVGPVEGLQVPNGLAPTDYHWDKRVDVGPGHANPERPGHKSDPEGTAEKDLEKTVDKLSLGQILT